jgi:hypothetical protein
MNFRRTAVIAFTFISAFSAAVPAVRAQAGNPLVLKYSAEEGLNGRTAKGATFKAWIDEGRPVVATADEEGRVELDLGRPLAKGQTLYVEAESASGDRFYSWVYRESDLSGHVRTTCQLVGIQDFRHPDLVTAQRAD